MSRPRRFGLIVFGAILVALFAVIAIANGGVGKPSVPSGDIIYVQEVPDGLGNISQDDYNRSFEQTWKRGGLKSAPKEGDAQYDQVKEAAINDLLDQGGAAFPPARPLEVRTRRILLRPGVLLGPGKVHARLAFVERCVVFAHIFS